MLDCSRVSVFSLLLEGLPCVNSDFSVSKRDAFRSGKGLDY